MECLYCGDCCERLSPLSSDHKNCLHIVRDGNFVFCGIYSKRPKECKNHEYPANYCPIGIEKLNITEAFEVSRRIDEGWEKIKDRLL